MSFFEKQLQGFEEDFKRENLTAGRKVDKFMGDMAKRAVETKEYSFTVIYRPVKEGGYEVAIPLLPGVVTYGRDFEEARKMARDAILCHLEALKKEKEEIPSEKALVQEKVTFTL